MNFNYELSKEIIKFIEDSELEEISIGCSESQIIRIKKNNQIYYLKMAKLGMLTKEYNKLKWLDGKLRVPRIVIYDKNDDTEFLITEAVRGEMVCSSKYQDNPELGIKIIAQAFKDIYAVDISECPFDVSIDYKLKLVETNVRDKLIDAMQVNEKYLLEFGSLEKILTFLQENKFYDEKCFSHGDISLPNLFADGNNFSGFIDVGECGIADKWFDLAICEKSIIRNFGLKYVGRFYEELGIIPDRKKIDYYILMMELYL